MQRTTPEFLELFQRGGDTKIVVRVPGRGGPRLGVASMALEWDELGKILDPETGRPWAFMAFDEHLYRVVRYEIDLAKNRLVIHVELPGQDDPVPDDGARFRPAADRPAGMDAPDLS